MVEGCCLSLTKMLSGFSGIPPDSKSGGVYFYPLVLFFLGYTLTTGCAVLFRPSAGKRESLYYQSASLVLASSVNPEPLSHREIRRFEICVLFIVRGGLDPKKGRENTKEKISD